MSPMSTRLPLSWFTARRALVRAACLTLGLTVLAGCGSSGEDKAASAKASDSGAGGSGGNGGSGDTSRGGPPTGTIASTAAGSDTTAPRGQSPRRGTRVSLSPDEQSIANSLVFAPRSQTWFVAATRGKQLLVDVGRVDTEVRRDSAKARAFRTVAAAQSPFAPGTSIRLRTPWGEENATVGEAVPWNGRITHALAVRGRTDSLVRAGAAVVALVEHGPASATSADANSASAPSPAACRRDSVPPALTARADAVRDSLSGALRNSAVAMGAAGARLVSAGSATASRVAGCFANGGRVIVAVSLRTPDRREMRERVALIDASGATHALLMRGSRFRSHDLTHALDVDRDGWDDIAANGVADRAGATVMFRLVNGRTLERVAGGFAWEGR